MNGNILQNADIIHQILFFLTDDGTSVARFALSCKELYNRILRHETCDPNLWKHLICHRWKRKRNQPTMIKHGKIRGSSSSDDNITSSISYRDLYIAKRCADSEAIRQLDQMTSVLRTALRLNETQRTVIVGNPHIGRAWDHHCWSFLLRNRADCYDVLKAIAAQYLADSPSSVHDKLRGFLAAICVKDFHFADCLREWKRLSEIGSGDTEPQTKVSQLKEAYLLEQKTLVVCAIQKTPLELLEDDFHSISNDDICDENDFESSTKNSRGVKFLDEIATVCMNRIHEELEGTANVIAKLEIVNDVLVNQYGFCGNSNDYYNYRNVLLDHVLESKTGMPLTLCLMYSCICRRLNIPVQITGLPGHIVLGFDTNENTNAATNQRSYIDVFHGCKILSTDNCRQIVTSYGIGWREDFLAPLSTKDTLQRIFNNLRNCHEKAIGAAARTPMFCSDLLFQQHTLGLIHRYPPEISSSLLDRMSQDLQIILSPDLLQAYDLLSSKNVGINPAVNATHARRLLELSSYAGLSFHNYA